MKIGLVDVGGGMRGIYAAGIMDYCLDMGIHFDCCIGVSAGSANIASYMAGQRGRSKTFYCEYALRDEYMSAENLIKKGSYVDLDYACSTLSNTDGENPLDYDALMANPAEMFVVAENAITGRPRYFTKHDIAKDNYDIFKASCCIPGVIKPYIVNKIPYFDGALADPVPIGKAFSAGCDRVLLILSKPLDLIRTPGNDVNFAKLIKKNYPLSAERLCKRAETYNKSVAEAKRLMAEGKVLILAPENTEGITTLKRDPENMELLYERGYNDASAIPQWISEFIDKKE